MACSWRFARGWIAASLGLGLTVGQASAASRVERGLGVDSTILATPLTYSVYLPDGYRSDDGRRYPVVYLLHGTDGGDTDWLDLGDLQATVDRLVADHEIPPLIVVMPAAGNSWYVDNPDAAAAQNEEVGAGSWALAFTQELVPAIDRRYATLAERGGRAVGGLSMGGYGAVRLAFADPGLFASAAALSGAFWRPGDRLSAADIAEFHGAFGTPPDQRRLDANNPFLMIPALVRAPQRPALYLASGDRDDYDLEEATAHLYMALKHAGIRARLHIRDGEHDWLFWSHELAPMLRFMAENFTPPGKGRIADLGQPAPPR